MAQKAVTELLNGLARIKWYRYRYVVVVLVLLNFIFISHFVFDRSLADLNPFPASAGTQDKVSIPVSDTTTSNKPAEPEKPAPKKPKPVAPKLPAVDPHLSPPEKFAGTFSLDDYDFNGQYVGWPLERVCREVKQTVGLVYVCDNNSGGIGNIRNFILTCVRYAIEAGATGIIMPRIQRRSETDLGALFSSSFQPFKYFFDEDHFRHVMGKHCSHLRIYDKAEDIPNGKHRNEATEFYPKDLITGGSGGDGCDDRGINRHIDQFREQHDLWLTRFSRYPNETVPLTVRFRWATFFEWNIFRDGSEFANTFGDILRINPDIQELAAITIGEMVKFIHSPAAIVAELEQKTIPKVDEPAPKDTKEGGPEKPTEETKVAVPPPKDTKVEEPEKPADETKVDGPPPKDTKAEEPKKPTEETKVEKPAKEKRTALNAPYLGVHLRTETDALGFWPNYDFQSAGYIKTAKERDLKFAFIATGNATEGHRFGELAFKELGMRVVGKTDLLKGENLKRLNSLTWDQQALVDFLVLSKSTHFTGCSFSSFTMNIAFKRHTMTGGIYSRPWKSPGDMYSTLVGRFENWYGDWMFMYECMWP